VKTPTVQGASLNGIKLSQTLPRDAFPAGVSDALILLKLSVSLDFVADVTYFVYRPSKIIQAVYLEDQLTALFFYSRHESIYN